MEIRVSKQSVPTTKDTEYNHKSKGVYKILMEYEFKQSVQPQRRVNPNIKEVVKKEFIKLLDARLIYPISDSPWVSPVQVVPKKGGITVVKNEKNKLIPQRTVTGLRIRDKKGAENLAADHLSRLENTYLGKLTKAEIRDLFLKERLMAVSGNNNEPWLSHSYSSNALTESYEGASPKMRLFPEKLKSRWYEPFSVCKDLKNGAIELYDEDGNEFIVNKQWVKPYQKDVLETDK
ncbi:hypothetical protein Tco_1128816 [Tanacetum coccineum]